VKQFPDFCLEGLKNNTNALRIISLRSEIEPGTSRIRSKRSSRWTLTIDVKIMFRPHEAVSIEGSLSEGHIEICVVSDL